MSSSASSRHRHVATVSADSCSCSMPSSASRSRTCSMDSQPNDRRFAAEEGTVYSRGAKSSEEGRSSCLFSCQRLSRRFNEMAKWENSLTLAQGHHAHSEDLYYSPRSGALRVVLLNSRADGSSLFCVASQSSPSGGRPPLPRCSSERPPSRGTHPGGGSSGGWGWSSPHTRTIIAASTAVAKWQAVQQVLRRHPWCCPGDGSSSHAYQTPEVDFLQVIWAGSNFVLPRTRFSGATRP